MYRIIGADGREYGPVTSEQLHQWIAEGRANAQTQVLEEGGTEWKSLSQLPEVADLFAAGSPTVAPPLTDNAAWAAEVSAGDYRIDLGGCLSRSWQLLTQNLGLLVGGSLLIGLVFLALAGVGMIPFVGFVGSIAQLILTGPLSGGLYWLFLQRVRGRTATVGDVFSGFSRGFANLMLVQIVSGLLVALWILPGGIGLGIGVFFAVAASHHGSAMTPVVIMLLGIGGLLFLAGLCVAVYLGACWKFAMLLAVDRQMGFWQAMQLSRAMMRKHWWAIFGTLWVFGLVASAGLLACCVGMLFTGPLAFGAIVYLYEDIFRAAPAQGV